MKTPLPPVPLLAALTPIIALLAGCTTFPPIGSGIDPAATDALRLMGEKIGTARQYTVSGSRKVASALLENPGQIGDARIEASVMRPDKAKLVMSGRKHERHIHLDRAGSAIFDKKTGHYALFPGKPTIDQSIDAAIEDFGLFIPLQDFLSADPYAGFASGLQSAQLLGNEKVGPSRHECRRIAGRRNDMRWDIWISTTDHLPRQLVFTLTGIEGTAHYRARFDEWNLAPGLDAKAFAFTPPEGATEIQFLD